MEGYISGYLIKRFFFKKKNGPFKKWQYSEPKIKCLVVCLHNNQAHLLKISSMCVDDSEILI